MGILSWVHQKNGEHWAKSIGLPPNSFGYFTKSVEQLRTIIGLENNIRLTSIKPILCNRLVAGYLFQYPISVIGNKLNLPRDKQYIFTGWVIREIIDRSSRDMIINHLEYKFSNPDEVFAIGMGLGENDYMEITSGKHRDALTWPLIYDENELAAVERLTKQIIAIAK